MSDGKDKPAVGGPYIVWVNNGYEGWSPTSYDSLAAAVFHESYGSQKVITKPVKVGVVEYP